MLVWNIRHSLTLLTCRLDEVEPAHGMEQPVDVLSNEAPLTSLVPHMHSRPKIGVARQKSIGFEVGGGRHLPYSTAANGKPSPAQ